MSVTLYQNAVARLMKEIADLKGQVGSETQKIARLRSDISSISRTINKYTSPSQVNMKLQQVAAKENEIGKCMRKVAEVENRISTRLKELHRNQQYLEQAQDQEQKKRNAEAEKQRSKQLKQAREITNELGKQQRRTSMGFSRGIGNSPVNLEGYIDMNAAYTPLGIGVKIDDIPESTQRRKGGPIPTSEEDKSAIIKGWLAVQGRKSQEAYCLEVGVSPSTLRKWIKSRLRRDS